MLICDMYISYILSICICIYIYIYKYVCVYIYIHIWITEHINYSTINHSYTLKPWPIYIHNLPCINGHVPQDLQQIHGLARAILGWSTSYHRGKWPAQKLCRSRTSLRAWLQPSYCKGFWLIIAISFWLMINSKSNIFI